MKRIAVVFLMALLALSAGAQELVFLHQGDGYYKDIPKEWKVDGEGFTSIWQKAIYYFEKANPGVRVRVMQSDLSMGSSLTLDVLLASGNPPDVVLRTGAVLAKLMVDSFAIQPDKYLDVAKYFTQSGLDACKIGGKLFALPTEASVSTMAVNLDHLAAIDYTLPPPAQWTTDEFLSVGRKLKASGKYITGLFAQNQSSDAWWLNWFMAFGGKLYANGDYSKTVLNSPQSVKALNFMKQLLDEGLALPNPGELNDDIVLDEWCKGKISMLSMQIPHTSIMQSYAKQGTISKEFPFTFIEFPHAAGQPRTPVNTGYAIVVGHKTADEKRNAIVAKLMLAMADSDNQYFSGMSGNFPSSKAALAKIAVVGTNPYWKIQQDSLSANGTWDRGNTIPQYSEIRAQLFPLMQEFYVGRIDAQTVLSRYEKAVNSILKN